MPEPHAFTVENLTQLEEAAARLLQSAQEARVFAFQGEMGAGKTTFIAALCKQLGVREQTSSPTFALVNEYRSDSGEPVYHFDFYRIQQEEEALAMGCEEYFYSGHYCFIEWPQKIYNLLPPGCVQVTIEVIPSTIARIITLPR